MSAQWSASHPGVRQVKAPTRDVGGDNAPVEVLVTKIIVAVRERGGSGVGKLMNCRLTPGARQPGANLPIARGQHPLCGQCGNSFRRIVEYAGQDCGIVLTE